jgi:hypothetical protein
VSPGTHDLGSGVHSTGLDPSVLFAMLKLGLLLLPHIRIIHLTVFVVLGLWTSLLAKFVEL